MLVGWNGYLHVEADLDGAEAALPAGAGPARASTHAEVFIGVFIGAVTFTGSIVAFLKLSARIKSNPLMLPGKNVLNLGALVAFAVLTGLVRDRPAAVAAGRGHRARARAGLAPGRLHRRRRHARGRLDAEQLLRLGGGRVRVPARATTC